MKGEWTLPFTLQLPYLSPIQGISYFAIFFFSAFIAAFVAARREFVRDRLDTKPLREILSFTLVGGWIGSRLGYLFEARQEIARSNQSILDIIFSSGGLVFYSGVLFALPILALYLYRTFGKIIAPKQLDALTPSLALGYAIGRLGCVVSGDGCYGHGAPYSIPVITHVFGPDSIFPTYTTPVWNTSLMEAAISLALYTYLAWSSQRLKSGPPFAVALFLAVNGTTRFLVEFLRLNPPLFSLWEIPGIHLANGSSVPLTYRNAIDFGPGAGYFLTHYRWHGPTLSQVLALALATWGYITLYGIWKRARSNRT